MNRTPDAATFGRIAAVSASATLGIGLIYGVGTEHGFVRNRWMIVKWGLSLVAVGGLASASYFRSPDLAAATTAAQLVAFALAAGVGVFLERSRHARLAAPPA